MARTDVDPDALKRYSFTVWSYKQGEVVSLLIHLGDELGLYRAMAGAGPLTSVDLAERTGLNERLLREWLLGNAAAGVIERVDDGVYELSPEGVAVLADEDNSLAFSGGAFRGGFEPDLIGALKESFRTGIGVTYEQQGPRAAAGLARMTGPWSRLALVSTILPALDGVVPKLEAGGTAVDVGCGSGVTVCTIAEAYPKARVIGYDPSSIAIGQARERAAEAQLDNATFVQGGAEDLPSDTGADFVLTFDCLHDMARPDKAMAAIRQAIAPDGTWLIKDIRSSGDFERDRRNPMLAMFYGFSVSSCLQSAMSTPDGLGLGTLGLHPAKAEEMVRAAGFSSFVTHDFEDVANLYYEVRV
jgi:2-polyprenyl-3-methyl-5-hydroxy-6-metoxy-1,4-benzoquinol methylase